MTRLASQCLKLAVVVAFALNCGASVWAQARTSKPEPHHVLRPATAPKKKMPRPAGWAHEKPVRRPKPHRMHPIAGARMARRHAEKAVASSSPVVSSAPAAQPASTSADTSLDLVGKRDPFVALVNRSKGGDQHLPPGKAGLVIGTLTVQGTVQGANGMIAVIANPDQRVYFVREGDRLYDGDVEKISLDAVTFQQNTKDAFGKPIERTVVKRIYPSAGEQQ